MTRTMQKINVVSPSADPKYSADHDLEDDAPKSAAYICNRSRVRLDDNSRNRAFLKGVPKFDALVLKTP